MSIVTGARFSGTFVVRPGPSIVKDGYVRLDVTFNRSDLSVVCIRRVLGAVAEPSGVLKINDPPRDLLMSAFQLAMGWIEADIFADWLEDRGRDDLYIDCSDLECDHATAWKNTLTALRAFGRDVTKAAGTAP